MWLWLEVLSGFIYNSKSSDKTESNLFVGFILLGIIENES